MPLFRYNPQHPYSGPYSYTLDPYYYREDFFEDPYSNHFEVEIKCVKEKPVISKMSTQKHETVTDRPSHNTCEIASHSNTTLGTKVKGGSNIFASQKDIITSPTTHISVDTNTENQLRSPLSMKG